MKALTPKIQAGNKVMRARRDYVRKVIAVGNFNKVHDQTSAAYYMTEVRHIHNELIAAEDVYNVCN